MAQARKKLLAIDLLRKDFLSVPPSRMLRNPRMSQEKEQEERKSINRFPNWLLFLVSIVAIFFSPLSYSGYVMGFSSIAPINLLSWVVEVIFFIVGIIPFAILDIREKRPPHAYHRDFCCYRYRPLLDWNNDCYDSCILACLTAGVTTVNTFQIAGRVPKIYQS